MFGWTRALASRIRAWLSPQQADQDFEHELDIHFDLLTEENVRRGMAPEEAERAARIRLGGHTQLKETNRELQGLPAIETFLQSTRSSFSMLRQNPSFTAVAVLTLALGIGANTAIFSVVENLLLRPLPYPQPERLVEIANTYLPQVPKAGLSPGDYADWRRENASFSEMGAHAINSQGFNLSWAGDPHRVEALYTTSGLFHFLGIRLAAGRAFFPRADPLWQAPLTIP